MRILAVLTLILVIGCGKKAADKPANAPKSTAQQAIEGFTGKTAVDQGKKASQELQRISAQKQADMEAVE